MVRGHKSADKGLCHARSLPVSWARLRSRWVGSPAGLCLTGSSFAKELSVGEEDSSAAPQWGRPTGGREPQLAGHGSRHHLRERGAQSPAGWMRAWCPGGTGMQSVSLRTARAGAPALCPSRLPSRTTVIFINCILILNSLHALLQNEVTGHLWSPHCPPTPSPLL